MQPHSVTDDPKALCETEGIRVCQNYGATRDKRTARLDTADFMKLYNDKIDDAAAFTEMRNHVLVQNVGDPLHTSAVTIVYFWLEFGNERNPDARLLGEHAADSI